MSELSVSLDQAHERWASLEQFSDPCVVVTGKMKLVYANEPARGVAADEWFGARCWDALPADPACVANCPAIGYVSRFESGYVEETIYPGGNPLRLGVVVNPLDSDSPLELGTALLVMRPIPEGANFADFQAALRITAAEILAASQT